MLFFFSVPLLRSLPAEKLSKLADVLEVVSVNNSYIYYP